MVAGRIWSRRPSRALLDAESVPLPASGTDITSPRPPATAAAVTGLWITPPAEALAWSAVTAARILGPEGGRIPPRRRPPATAAAVTGLWITPPAEALAWSAVTAARILGPERSPPVTTTSAGDGRPGKAQIGR